MGSETSNSSPIPGLYWSVWPAGERPSLALFVAVAILATAIAIRAVFDSYVLAVVAMGFLLLALSSFFFPSSYTLDEWGVRVRSTFFSRKREWAAFRGWQADDAGLLLSPFSSEHWLADTRGVYLRFGSQGEAVREFVRRRLPQINAHE